MDVPEKPLTENGGKGDNTEALKSKEEATLGSENSPLHINITNHQPQDSLPISPGPMSPDPVHDLPVELLQAGWRRFWSKREQRPYFFNKLTNESLWEMPQLESGVIYIFLLSVLINSQFYQPFMITFYDVLIPCP